MSQEPPRKNQSNRDRGQGQGQQNNRPAQSGGGQLQVIPSPTLPPRSQWTLMSHDPVDGSARPYPSLAEHYRHFHGPTAWLFNLWTGKARDPRDIGSDVHGFLIKPVGEAVYAGR